MTISTLMPSFVWTTVCTNLTAERSDLLTTGRPLPLLSFSMLSRSSRALWNAILMKLDLIWLLSHPKGPLSTINYHYRYYPNALHLSFSFFKSDFVHEYISISWKRCPKPWHPAGWTENDFAWSKDVIGT